jgi:hypothetical protein
VTVNGKATLPIYLVSILLPNQLGFDKIEVVSAKTLGDEDILIGMDIITEGDLAITNFNMKTMFSFRVPSNENIDFRE